MKYLILAGVWCLPSVLVVAWVLADRWLDSRMPVDGADAEWLEALSDTPIYEELHVERLRADLNQWGRS